MVLKLLLPAVMAYSGMLIPTRIANQLVASRPDEVEMNDIEIRKEWIVSGEPKARVGLHSKSYDRHCSTFVWECTAGVFNWHFGADETVYILDGAVHVTMGGERRTLGPGDIAFFPGGSVALWEVDSHVRKIAFCRSTGISLERISKLFSRMMK